MKKRYAVTFTGTVTIYVDAIHEDDAEIKARDILNKSSANIWDIDGTMIEDTEE